MQITAGGINLAGDPAQNGFDGHQGLVSDHEDMIQTEAVVDGDAPFRAHRGNRIYTVEFKAQKRLADEAAADALWVTLTTGFTTLVSASVGSLSLTDCEVHVRPSVQGCVVAYQVSIKGCGS